MATLHFELVAPERVIFSGEVEAVLLPASEGDMTVLPGHVPTMTALKAGFVVITSHKNEGSRVLVRGGFAEITASGVAVLAERATPIEELSSEKLDHEIDDARMIRDASADHEARRAADMLVAQLREAKEALKF
jgi:F-type H+-transporting ATPase subunit epsilon